MSRISSEIPAQWDAEVPLLILGAGAAGICAALAAKEAGADTVVVERDAVPSGSTGLSAGLIPAAGTRFQRNKGVADCPRRLADDIKRKTAGDVDAAIAEAVAHGSAPLIEWLVDRYALPFELVENFNYPGHSALRMHGLPTRTGRELIDRLRHAAEQSDVVILNETRAERLFADATGHVHGVEVVRRDGTRERIGCAALILACSGYGGNPELVRRFIPEMAEALYFGHPGNRGDAVQWGEALGAQLACLGAYQGHGSVATPHNILITWAVIMEGGIQVNIEGRRFCDETRGYSEQASEVLRQPEGLAWSVFDARIAGIARQFEDFQAAERMSAILTAATTSELAAKMHVPADVLAEELESVETHKARGATDRFGRHHFCERRLSPPYCAVKVTGALFHTQGGLAINADGRVKRKDGALFSNLFAAGGAASGVSGRTAGGYLSGNGLLTATVLGRLAGTAAAELISR